MANPFGYTKTYQDGVFTNTESANDGDILSYSSSDRRYKPVSVGSIPQAFTFTGTIKNISATRYIRWGQNVNGDADSILVPFKCKVLGFSASFNDTVPIDTGTNGDWTITLGSVYDTTPSETDCSNSGSNFNDVLSKVHTRAQLIASNGYPQFTKLGGSLELPAGSRISFKSVVTGDLNFNTGDVVVTLFLASKTDIIGASSYSTQIFG